MLSGKLWIAWRIRRLVEIQLRRVIAVVIGLVERERRVGIEVADGVGRRTQWEFGNVEIAKVAAAAARALGRRLMSRNHLALSSLWSMLVARLVENRRDIRT
jgi:hypothetical protein